MRALFVKTATILAAIAAFATFIAYFIERKSTIEGFGLTSSEESEPDYESIGGQAALQLAGEMGATFLGYTFLLVAALWSGNPHTIKIALWTYAIVDIVSAVAGFAGTATGVYPRNNAIACLVLAAIFIAATFCVEPVVSEYEQIVT